MSHNKDNGKEFDKWIKKGDNSLESRNYEKALKYYNKALEINSKAFIALYYKGITLYSMNKFKEALNVLNQVMILPTYI